MRTISDAFVLVLISTCLAELTKKSDKAWRYFIIIVIVLLLGI